MLGMLCCSTGSMATSVQPLLQVIICSMLQFLLPFRSGSKPIRSSGLQFVMASSGSVFGSLLTQSPGELPFPLVSLFCYAVFASLFKGFAPRGI